MTDVEKQLNRPTHEIFLLLKNKKYVALRKSYDSKFPKVWFCWRKKPSVNTLREWWTEFVEANVMRKYWMRDGWLSGLDYSDS
jgi:hypothetical protein